MKITAGVVVRNEAAFLRKSILSIYPFVDRVVIVENGSVDGSDVICDELTNNFPGITCVHLPAEASLATARNVIDDLAEDGWIVWWDADFIAYSDSDGEGRSFSRMIDVIKKFTSTHNQIFYGGPNVGPTFDTVQQNKRHHGTDFDAQITRKGLMRFRVAQYIDTRYYTEDCKPLYLSSEDHQYYLHLDKIKPLSRLSLRVNLYDFESTKFKSGTQSKPDILTRMIERDRNFNIQSIQNDVCRSLVANASSFDFDKFGPHPSILHAEIENPYYTIESASSGGRVLVRRRSFTRNDDIYNRPYYVPQSPSLPDSSLSLMTLAPKRKIAFLRNAVIDSASELQEDQDEFGRFIWVNQNVKIKLNQYDDSDYLRIGFHNSSAKMLIVTIPTGDVNCNSDVIDISEQGHHWATLKVGSASHVEIRFMQRASEDAEGNLLRVKLYYLSKIKQIDDKILFATGSYYGALEHDTTLVDTLTSCSG